MFKRVRFIFDGTPCEVKAACTVWSGGKSDDDFKGLPITIRLEKPGHEALDAELVVMIYERKNAIQTGRRVSREETPISCKEAPSGKCRICHTWQRAAASVKRRRSGSFGLWRLQKQFVLFAVRADFFQHGADAGQHHAVYLTG